MELDNGFKAWDFSSPEYVQFAVKNVGDYLKGKERKLPTKTITPTRTIYWTEIDVLP